MKTIGTRTFIAAGFLHLDFYRTPHLRRRRAPILE